MKANEQKSKKLPILNYYVAGIDVGSRVHYVAVPEELSETPVRNFESFTSDLHNLAKWLKQCKITSVAMESTGIYWIQLYLVLEQYGFEVLLVNASHIKNVAGRKSDVLDCQWIQQLHSYGLLNASFQPDNLTRELRAYMRHRKNLTENYCVHVLHMQKAFEQMNIKLHIVLSDIVGKSGRQIIEAILNGERNAEKLADLVTNSVKASKAEIIKSLEGTWRNENIFELQQAYELYQIYKEKIKECDEKIENVLNQYERKTSSDDNDIKKKRGVYTKNRLNFNGTEHLKRILGVDPTKIFGISEITALEIISEAGTDMSKWPSKKHFTSWLNLAPNNRISGGKMQKHKKNRKKNRAGQAFMMAAYALQRSDHWLGEYYRRMKSKHGPKVATKATARKLAIIFYEMLSKQVDFNPIPKDSYNENLKQRKLKYIENQAKKLGMELVPL